MKSFLILVDINGSIIETKWCDPVSIINEKIYKIKDIFEFKHRESIQNAILNCSKGQEQRSILENQKLLIEQSDLNLSFVKSNNGVYIFALQSYDNSESYEYEALQDLFYRFLSLIQMSDYHLGFRNPESSRFQFEEIQSLNNELVNTKRMLEKSNAQLNFLNKELNNRLVKDPLTGLVSRYQYRSEIEYRISQHKDDLGVFMFIDIDDFKRINDTLGHGAGDEYLIEFSNRLKNIPIPNSIKLRIAGDEFGLFVYGIHSTEEIDLQFYWELIKHHVLSEPFIYDGHRLVFSISVGMAIYGLDTKEVYEIIEFADFAMYTAKKSGKNRYSRFNFDEYNRRNR